MSVLITGGSGFVGKYIFKQICKFSDEIPICFDIQSCPNSEVASCIGDITQIDALIKAIEHYKVTKIIHLASLRNLGSQQNPQLAFRLNCQGTVNVLEAARIMNVKRVVCASTVAVFGPKKYYENLGIGEKPLKENSPVKPHNIYGVTKAFVEYWAHQYNKIYDMDNICIRLSILFGPGKTIGSKTSEFNDVIESAYKNKPFKISRYNNVKINLQYVKDAADALLTATFTNRSHSDLYNSGGYNILISDFVDLVRNLLPNSDIKLINDNKCREVWSMIDTNKIKHEIGFFPRYSLVEAIKDHLNELKLKRKEEKL